jgi:mxaL protein
LISPRGAIAAVAARRIGAYLGAIALLLPVFLEPRLPLEGETFAYLYVIDVSESMNVRDVEPAPATESRLDRAKSTVVASMATLPCGSRVAVALFAGSETLTLFEPLEVCRHFPAIEQSVNGIDWRMAWDGDSRVEAALLAALTEARQRDLDLVFLSDGDETPHVVVPHMADLLAVQGKVRGVLVGVGGAEAKPVPKLDADNRIVGYWSAVDAVREGFYPNLSELVKQTASAAELERSGALDEVRDHRSALNEEYLQQVGAAAGLGYVRADSAGHVASALLGAAHARYARAERDVRLVFGLLSAMFVALGWVRRRPDGAGERVSSRFGTVARVAPMT